MSDESTPLPPKPEERRGRPKGVKDKFPRRPYVYKSVTVDGDTKHGHGHRRLRGAQQLHLLNEMRIRRNAGETLSSIEATLKLAKGTAFRNLYGNKERKIMKLIVDEMMIDSFLIVAEGLEVVKMEMVHMKTKSALGELDLSPEQAGTLVRTIEKAKDIYMMVSGKQMLGLAAPKEEPKDPALERAKERLKELEAEGGVVDQ